MANCSTTDPFNPTGPAAPGTQVEISISCRRLKDKDFFSKSDPMVVMFLRECESDNWREVGRTEVVYNCLNPDFVTKFIVDYYFEERQQLLFKVFDIDSPSANLQNHDFLGQAQCTLGELVSYQGKQVKVPLSSAETETGENTTAGGTETESIKDVKKAGPASGLPGNCGTIIITVEEVLDCKKIVDMQWCAEKVDKKDWFGKSDPFLEFYRTNEDSSYSAVYRTEVVKKCLNPIWRPFAISLRQLCGGDEDRSIRVTCLDWDFDGGHDFIGEFYTNVRTLLLGSGPQNEYELINPKKQAKKRRYKNSGVVKLMSISVREEPSFLDYIRGGLQMHFTVAVDFTASNGDPNDPESLHYMGGHTPNAYKMAIKAVGDIIQDYDADKMFPALGFGARLPPDGKVSHEFFLNGHSSDPYCHGVDGVLEAYERTLKTVQLYGPTNFAPVINHVAKFARAYMDGTNYFVLLIITDGVINDMPQTQEAIVRAASLPMSIIIVGVGNNTDFSDMEILDGDVVRVSSRGRAAERDIVQFVPFKKFLQGGPWERNQSRLAKEVLAEIPEQVTGYMLKNHIKPGLPTAPPETIQEVSDDNGTTENTPASGDVTSRHHHRSTADSVV